MTVTVTANHTYKEPVEVVAATHLSKYPNKYDPSVLSCNVIEKKTNKLQESYTKQIAICKNIIPMMLRKGSLDVDDIKIEEECSWDRKTRTFLVNSRNVTLESWVTMQESSHYEPHHLNDQWTHFTQSGTLTINGLGRFGYLIELFGKKFLTAGANRSIKITELLMTERNHKLYSFWYSQFIFA